MFEPHTLTTSICVNSVPVVFNASLETLLAHKGQQIAIQTYNRVADISLVTQWDLVMRVCVCATMLVFSCLFEAGSESQEHSSICQVV